MLVSDTIYELQVDQNVPIRMRDGAILWADVYRPKADGEFPVIIERTQAWRGEGGAHQCPVTGKFFAHQGYAYVAQDVRGAFGSDGQFYFGRNDGWGFHQDGFDTIEWAAKQPWSNGRVGMVGYCGTGMTQYQVVPTRPPHLKTLFVAIGGAHKNYFYRNNVYRLSQHRGQAFWFQLLQLQHESAPPGMEGFCATLEKTMQDPGEMDRWFRHLPLRSYPPGEHMGEWYHNPLDHPEDGPYWWESDVSRKFTEIDIPIVHLGGWFDFALDVSLQYFSGIQENGHTEDCRRGQRLIVGPWGHLNIGERRIGELDFGPEATFDVNSARLKWFDHWLKEITPDVLQESPVRLFLMGENRWIDMETWPPTDVEYRPLYFREGSGANNESLNNGSLTFAQPPESEIPDHFSYDPEDPIPSLASDIDFLPADYRSLEKRMLTFTSEPLEKPIRVVGPVKAILFGRSSAPDTDWVVRLSDVWPDGRSISVCDGIIRSRYRDSLECEELMVPGKTYRFEVDLWATAQTFSPGHRIRVAVTSSDFPRYDRNLNTGEPFGEGVHGQVAVNTIFHNLSKPSQIILPIMR